MQVYMSVPWSRARWKHWLSQLPLLPVICVGLCLAYVLRVAATYLYAGRLAFPVRVRKRIYYPRHTALAPMKVFFGFAMSAHASLMTFAS